MSDIYLSLTETPTVVTLSQPVVSGALSSSVTVTNVVSVNVVTMPAINVTAAAPSVTTVVGTVAVSNFPASSSVTIGGFSTSSLPPSTVTVANSVTINGTVTANLPTSGAFGGSLQGYNGTNTYLNVGLQNIGGTSLNGASNLPISGTVTLGNSVTIGSLPAISGTVTAYAVGKYAISGNTFVDKNIATDVNGQSLVNAVVNGASVFSHDGQSHIFAKLTPNTTVTIGSLPAISGTVTVGAMPSGSLTTRFGTPTTANTAFATSAVTNANRKYLLIQNVTTGSNVITVGIGFTPTTTQGIQLTAGAGITFESSYIPTGQIFVLSSVTASNFTILEA